MRLCRFDYVFDAPAQIGYPGIMKFLCRISEKDGLWTVQHAGPDIGPIRVTSTTREEALRKTEDEIRYWLEMCPCSGQTYRNLKIEVEESI